MGKKTGSYNCIVKVYKKRTVKSQLHRDWQSTPSLSALLHSSSKETPLNDDLMASNSSLPEFSECTSPTSGSESSSSSLDICSSRSTDSQCDEGDNAATHGKNKRKSLTTDVTPEMFASHPVVVAAKAYVKECMMKKTSYDDNDDDKDNDNDSLVEFLMRALQTLDDDWRKKCSQCAFLHSATKKLLVQNQLSRERLQRTSYRLEQAHLKLQSVTFLHDEDVSDAEHVQKASLSRCFEKADEGKDSGCDTSRDKDPQGGKDDGVDGEKNVKRTVGERYSNAQKLVSACVNSVAIAKKKHISSLPDSESSVGNDDSESFVPQQSTRVTVVRPQRKTSTANTSTAAVSCPTSNVVVDDTDSKFITPEPSTTCAGSQVHSPRHEAFCHVIRQREAAQERAAQLEQAVRRMQQQLEHLQCHLRCSATTNEEQPSMRRWTRRVPFRLRLRGGSHNNNNNNSHKETRWFVKAELDKGLGVTPSPAYEYDDSDILTRDSFNTTPEFVVQYLSNLQADAERAVRTAPSAKAFASKQLEI